MLIAVTGATGFVGGHAVRRLLRDSHEVIAYGRRPRLNLPPHPRLSYRRWDIASGPTEAPRVDAVVHCAGSVTEWGRDEDFDRANVAGTRHVLASFRDAGGFVHMSTASVYDLMTRKRDIDEDTRLASRHLTGYSRTKIEAERLVAAAGGNSVILRPHIVYGPGDSKILPRLLAMRRRGMLAVPGDGRARVSVTHVENLSDAVARAVGRRQGHEVFNVADSLSGTVDELLTALQLAFHLRPRIRHVPISMAWPAAVGVEAIHRALIRHRAPLLTRFLVAQLAMDFTLDIRRAVEVLGYWPERSYPAAFAELASQSQPEGLWSARSGSATGPRTPPAVDKLG